MITVKLQGGLGNIFFQYAVGRVLAGRSNTALRLDLSHYAGLRSLRARTLANELGRFQFNAEIYLPPISKRLASYLPSGKTAENNTFTERKFGYDPAVLELVDGYTLEGYFQSEKYFKNIEQEIRIALQLKAPFSGKQVCDYGKAIRGSNSIAIHVRRGDYLKKSLHNTCTSAYFIKSIEHLYESVDDPVFFVFSDDIEWCRANIGSAEYHFVDIRIPERRLADFYLMSLCKHTIISNSSFSWWAAWLNGNSEKIIVSPNRWFNDKGMNEQALRDTIPEGWVRIDV